LDIEVETRAQKMAIRLRPLSRAEVRCLDAQAADELALPGILLMENAGRGAAACLAKLAGNRPSDIGVCASSSSEWLHSNVLAVPTAPKVVILCGPGNNGGDGAVVARHLDGWGFPVRVVWFAQSNELRGDAAKQWAILQKSRIDQLAWFDAYPVDSDPDCALLGPILVDADWLVDGLLGTGLARPVVGPFRTMIELMNHTGKPILSLDLPSGLDADTGQPLGTAVRARATVTFVAPKLGFSAPGANAYTGEVTVVDIGLPRCLLEPYRMVEHCA
jgi:NAD(P)H-hydrate epimerase